jgi:hypothetical protein
MAVHAQFCGRCGAQIPPGAPYCGRCGAQQYPLPAAAPPAYAYAYAPPAAPAPRLGGYSAAQIAVAFALLATLSVVTIGLSAFAVSQVIGTHSTCTSNCAPRIVTALPAPATYKSSAYGYQLPYDPAWTVRSQDAEGITLATRLGLLQVVGVKAGQPLDQVLQAVVSALPSSTWQSVVHVTDLKGAHIGDQDGLGAVYSANLIATNGSAAKVRFFVIVATRGATTVTMFGVNPADPKDYANGIPEGEEFDAICQEFQWGLT